MIHRIMTTEQLVELYAEAWRNLEADIIAPFLSQNFTYSSMWVFETLDKENYINYLKGKFNAIRTSGGKPVVSTGSNETGIPSVILKQGGNPPVYITVKASEGLISEAYMMAF